MNKITLSILAISITLVSFGQTQRVTLVETFTSSTCPPCNPGNVLLEGILDNAVNDDKFVSLKYQMSWPGSGDPYFTDEGNTRRNFYSVNAVPYTRVDGENGVSTDGFNQGYLNSAYAQAPKVDIDAYYQVTPGTQTVDLQVDIEALVDFGPGSRLMAAIFEYKTFNNVKSNGETEFVHVMKKLMEGSNGTVIQPMTTGEVNHFDFSYTFNGSYVLPPNANSPIDHSIEHSIEEFTDLGIVVWVQNMGIKEVYQAEYAKMGFNPLSVEENESIVEAKIYPNPASNNAVVAFHTTEVQDVMIKTINSLGQEVASEVIENVAPGRNTYEMNTSILPNGMYTIVIASEIGSLRKQLIIQK